MNYPSCGSSRSAALPAGLRTVPGHGCLRDLRGNPLSGAFSLGNDRLGDAVVRVLASRPPGPTSSPGGVCRASSFLLELPPEPSMLTATRLTWSRRTSCHPTKCDIHDPEVDAQEPEVCVHRRIGYLRCVKVESALPVEQVRLANWHCSKSIACQSAHTKAPICAAVDSPDAHRTVGTSHDSSGHQTAGGAPAEGALRCADARRRSCSVSHLLDRVLCGLCSEPEPQADVAIGHRAEE